MKTPIIIIILTCGCFVSTYSQINLKRKNAMTADILSGYPFEKLAFGNNRWFKLNSLQIDKTGEFLLNKSQCTSKINEKEIVQNMPCYKPEGVFTMRIIKPDTTIKYTMLVKKY